MFDTHSVTLGLLGFVAGVVVTRLLLSLREPEVIIKKYCKAGCGRLLHPSWDKDYCPGFETFQDCERFSPPDMEPGVLLSNKCHKLGCKETQIEGSRYCEEHDKDWRELRCTCPKPGGYDHHCPLHGSTPISNPEDDTHFINWMGTTPLSPKCSVHKSSMIYLGNHNYACIECNPQLKKALALDDELTDLVAEEIEKGNSE